MIIKNLTTLTNSKFFFYSYLILVVIIYTYKLSLFPIFADEAIYLHWAKRISLGEESIFISMFDGKTPLFIWLTVIFYNLSHNLLLSGRLVSVLSLIILLWVIFHFLKKVNHLWAWISVLLITFSPFVFFHARLSLMDMLLSLLLLSSILIFSHTKTNSQAVLSGLLLGLAFLAKVPALFVYPFPLINIPGNLKNYQVIKKISLVIFIALVFVLLLKFQIWFPNLFTRSKDFTFSLREIFSGEYIHIISNTKTFFSWIVFYLSYPLVIASIASLIYIVKKLDSLRLNLLTSLILFTTPFILLGKVIYARYYLLSTLIILIFSALTISKIPKKYILFLTPILFYFIYVDYLVIINPLNARLSPQDKAQYLMDWSSGIGLKESAIFFQQQAKNNRVKILTEGYFGTLPDGLFVYLDPINSDSNLEVVGVGTAGSKDYFKQLSIHNYDVVYYIGNQDRISIDYQEKLDLVNSYDKLEQGPPLQIYQITEIPN